MPDESAQKNNDQNQTTSVPPTEPVTPSSDPPVTPEPVITPIPEETPVPLPDLTHDIPPAPDNPEPPLSPQGETEQVPDPTSPPPASVTDVPEPSSIPPIITPPAPARSKAKIVGALLAILILVVSIPAGIFLVRQNQDTREKAAAPAQVTTSAVTSGYG